MNEPPELSTGSLWRRLAEAQDAALDARRSPQWAPEPADPTASFRPRPRRRLRIDVALGAAASAAVVVVALVALIAHTHKGKGMVGSQSSGTAAPVVAGRDLRADARSDLPLQFSDGSTITFRAGSAGSLRRLTKTGADVLLEHGELYAHVVHAESTLWLVHAGPFRVRVTGTRFAVGWAAAKLTVVVYEGAVVVDGAPLGAGIPLRAGQRLTVDGGIVRTEALARPAVARPAGAGSAGEPWPPGASGVTPPNASDPTVGAPRSLTPGSSHGRDWKSAAERGDYPAALRVARRSGWSGLCAHLSARQLLMLGDVARYAGAPSEAHRAFRSLVGRFPHDRLAADATFSLGRLAFEAGRLSEAARWFRRYVHDSPNGPLAEQALGRLVECAMGIGDRAAARRAAEDYLARAPDGAHAPLARQVLTAGSDGTP